MHRTLWRIQYSPASGRLSSHPSFNAHVANPARSPTRPLPPTALVFPSVTPSSQIGRLFRSEAIQITAEKSWSETSSSESTHPSNPLEWNKDGGLGQGGSRLHALERSLLEKSVRSETSRTHSSHSTRLTLDEGKTSLAKPGNLHVRGNYELEEAWSHFLELQARADFSPLTNVGSELLRNNILRAALNDSTRMVVFYNVAQHLRDQLEFEWPELYVRVIYFYLSQANYETTSMWHIRLMTTFTPTLDQFQMLLSSFAIDPTRELQDILKKIYIFSPLRSVYDHLIPTLFEYGQSQTARAWRKRLVLYGDFPSSPRSQPFLEFCTRYYPLQPLSEQELSIVDQNWGSPSQSEDLSGSSPNSRASKGIYSDSFTARWFASSWTSVDFAIDLMHKIGLKSIGPRSLQSLALREDNVDDVANRIAQLEKLGIAISPTTYCRALVTFAKEHQQELLTELLYCDIHPDEFDDKNTRRMLIEAAKRRQNETQERLFIEVESIALGRPMASEKPPPRDLNQLLKPILARNDLARARLLLDRMESEGIGLSHTNATKLLEQVFRSLWYFPKKAQQKTHGKGRDPRLDRAIHIIRRVAQHDVAIPLKYWRIILYNLGRLGRFDELEELSHEIVDMYTSTLVGLLPVHRYDLPPQSGSAVKKKPQAHKTVHENTDGNIRDTETWPEFLDDFWRNEVGLGDPTDSSERDQPMQQIQQRQKRIPTPDVMYYIPSDLPLSNQQHPVAKLFDTSLQRAVIRWGFDTKLASPPTTHSLMQLTTPRSADFDIAWGVRFMATLRDRGLHIDAQVLRSVLISRISIAQVPGRNRHRSRDERELSPAKLKRLIDEAWGNELLPTLPRFVKQLEDHKPKLWSQYPTLIGKAYDPEDTIDRPTTRRLGT